jgi:hypothetical protein
MVYKNKKSRKAIPGYTLVPKGDYYQVIKIGMTGDRVKNDPAFAHSRKLADEFARTGKMCKLIRDTFLAEIKVPSKPQLLMAALLEVLHTDTTNGLGDRSFEAADFSSLTGFNFNPEIAFEQLINLELIIEHRPEKEQLQVIIPAFIPEAQVSGGTGFTNFSIYMSCVGIDTKEMAVTAHTQRSTLLPLKELKVLRKKMLFPMPAGSSSVYLLAASVKFYNINILSKRRSSKDGERPLTIIHTYRPHGSIIK